MRSEEQFRAWLAAQGKWSPKAQNDLISRLRRAGRLVSLDSTISVVQYVLALESHPEWLLIPSASRTSVIGAARVYFEWSASTN